MLTTTGFCLIFLSFSATQIGSIVPTTVSKLFSSSSTTWFTPAFKSLNLLAFQQTLYICGFGNMFFYNNKNAYLLSLQQLAWLHFCISRSWCPLSSQLSAQNRCVMRRKKNTNIFFVLVLWACSYLDHHGWGLLGRICIIMESRNE